MLAATTSGDCSEQAEPLHICPEGFRAAVGWTACILAPSAPIGKAVLYGDDERAEQIAMALAERYGFSF